jgi:peptidoglycan/LPS O-acetylase OafA/YrhL
MLQDLEYARPGVVVEPFADNIPLWSLSYEWWFYMLFFPVYSFISERIQLRIVTVIALIAIVAYNVTYFQPLLFLAYFPIWWCGAEISRAFIRKNPFPFTKILLALRAC